MLEAFLQTVGYELTGANGAFVFVLLTLLIGGWAAWRSGQAQAQRWGPPWPLSIYVAALAAGVRFLDYALFSGVLLSIPNYLVDLVILSAIALLGYRMRRVRLVTEQYPWLFERKGPFAWKSGNDPFHRG